MSHQIAVLDGVRQHSVDYTGDVLPVTLWRDAKSGRLVVRAMNEGGCNYTEVDAEDLLVWLSREMPKFSDGVLS